jgi:hypothetical protein
MAAAAAPLSPIPTAKSGATKTNVAYYLNPHSLFDRKKAASRVKLDSNYPRFARSLEIVHYFNAPFYIPNSPNAQRTFIPFT